MNCFTIVHAALFTGLFLSGLRPLHGAEPASLPDALVSPTSSPLAKIQLIYFQAKKPSADPDNDSAKETGALPQTAAGNLVFLGPQVTGFVVEGGYFVSIAHMFETNLIRNLEKGKPLAAYMKFPLFEPQFFGLDVKDFPDDVIYFDESRSLFRNHTYFVKLTPVRQNFEQDMTLWSFSPKIARRLPALKLSADTTASTTRSYYMLQSANPDNATGYLLNRLSLNGIMFAHSPLDQPVCYIPCDGRVIVDRDLNPNPRTADERKLLVNGAQHTCVLGKRYMFDGYFKFGSSGSPILNDKFEVIGIQSEALYTQYRYNDFMPSGEVGEKHGLIFNRCVAVPGAIIAQEIAKAESAGKR